MKYNTQRFLIVIIGSGIRFKYLYTYHLSILRFKDQYLCNFFEIVLL